jgi:anti-sigma factor RsiW
MNVAILTRLTGRHLDDAALAELWTNATADGSGVPGHPHLASCAECRVRYASFEAWMDGIRSEAVSEADEVFTPERLKAQQGQIFRRIEAAEQPTRIIAFPRTPVGAHRPSPFRRWVAGAAAAGLIAGIGLGQIFHLGRSSPTVAPPQTERIVADNRVSNPIVPAVFNEELALRELDEVATPRYDALRAYDTFTPRAADYIQPR